MNKLLLCAVAAATLSSTAAHSQSVLGEFSKLQPQQQQVATYAMMHYSINFFHPNGAPLQQSDPEFPTMAKYTYVCNIAAIRALNDGRNWTPEGIAIGKTNCLQFWANHYGLNLSVQLTQH